MADTFRKKTMSHWEASNWLRRFYYALDHHPELRIRFKKDMKDVRAKGVQQVTRTRFGVKGNITGLHEWDYDEDGKLIGWTITLNPSRRRYGGFVKAIIHEMVHHVRPKWNEEDVRAHENLIYEALTNRQLWNLMQRVFMHKGKLKGKKAKRNA